MLVQEIIRRKRDGETLAPEEIAWFVAGLSSGAVGEGQAAAFAMTAFLKGLSRAETAVLTAAMRDSGQVLDWPDLDGPVLDKHSTGGVGDNVSLILAPILAACGAFVPMIAGRGLGHTGGTIDKLESIPGYDTNPDLARFRRAVATAGAAIIGQTETIAPADRRLYAIRDVTGTVESIPLITASILAKKLAAGLDALVLDVKTGSGAFMASRDEATMLARSLVEVANESGLTASALITDMNQPLALAAGNAVEVLNALELLKGGIFDRRLREVTLGLAAEMLVLGGIADDHTSAREKAEAALASGAAAERFGRMVAALGGPEDFVERPVVHLETAAVIREVPAPRPGFVQSIDTRAIGVAVVELGGGRRLASDVIDHAVGFTRLAGIGAEVGPDAPLALVHARDETSAERAAATLRAAYTVGDEAPGTTPVVLERIGNAETGNS